MAMPQQVPQGQPSQQPGQAPSAPSQGGGQDQGQGQQNPLIQLFVATDKGLLQVAQVTGKISQGAGQAFGKLEQQYRQMVTQFVDQVDKSQKGGGQPQGRPQQPANQAAPMNAGAGPQQQAM